MSGWEKAVADKYASAYLALVPATPLRCQTGALAAIARGIEAALDEVADWHTYGPERDAAALKAFKEAS